MFKVDPVRLDYGELVELERCANAHTSTQRAARRAKVILLCAQGIPLRQIAERVGMDQHQVGLWRKTIPRGSLDGLNDQPRAGRPRRLGHDERMQIAAVATSERDPDDPIVSVATGFCPLPARTGCPLTASKITQRDHVLCGRLMVSRDRLRRFPSGRWNILDRDYERR